MRIMAVSDLHGNLEGLDPKGADVVVLAGDIAPLKGRGVWYVNDQKKWINKRFREWTESYPDIQFVVIPAIMISFRLRISCSKGMMSIGSTSFRPMPISLVIRWWR